MNVFEENILLHLAEDKNKQPTLGSVVVEDKT